MKEESVEMMQSLLLAAQMLGYNVIGSLIQHTIVISCETHAINLFIDNNFMRASVLCLDGDWQEIEKLESENEDEHQKLLNYLMELL